MKIWIIGRSFPDSDNNMMGYFELEQAQMIASDSDEVHYICGQLKYGQPIKGQGYYTWNEKKVRVHTLSNLFMLRICHFFLPDIRTFHWKKLLKKVSDDYGYPDIIHVHYPAMLMIAEAVKEYKKKGAKIVATEHWSKVLKTSLNRIEVSEIKKYCDCVSLFICVSNLLAQSLKSTLNEKKATVAILPNTVDSSFMPNSEKHDHYEFIAVGRLVKMKQFDQIIIAFTKSFRGKNVKLTIVGDGKERDYLQELIKSNGMEKQIEMTGILQRKEIAHRIASADCLVCYSQYETFGVPVIEAWACGIPSIITDTMGISSGELDENLGVTIPCNNDDALIHAMQSMVENKSKYDKDYISSYANDNYSEQAVCKKLHALYRQIMNT